MFILKGCPKRDYSNSNPFHINYKILLFGLQFDGPQKILWTTILRWAIIIGEWTHLPISTVLNLKRLWSVKLIDGASNLECSDRAKFIRIIQQAGCCHGHDFELWNRLLCWTKPGHVPTFQPLMYKKYFGQDIPWAHIIDSWRPQKVLFSPGNSLSDGCQNT